MTTGPGGYGRLAPAAVACTAIVCGGLLWLAAGSAAAAAAAQPSLRVDSGFASSGHRATWLASSDDDSNSPDDDNDDDAPAAGAAIVTALNSAVRDDQAWEPVALEDALHAGTDRDSQSLRGPPALDDDDPISPDDDDDDEGDPDHAIAEPLDAPDLSEHSFDVADVIPASAHALVSRSSALRAPPVSTI